MTTDRILAMVRSLVTPLQDTLSVYLAAPPPSPIRPVADAERRWRALEQRMRARGVDQQTLGAIWTTARSAAAIRSGVAVFARDGRVVYTQRLPAWTGEDLATFGAPPHVVPLMGWLQTQTPYVVVSGADIVAFENTRHPLASIRVPVAAVAEHAVRVARTIEAHVILTTGPVLELRDQPDLAVVRIPDDGCAHVAEAVDRHVTARQHALVARFDNLRGPAGVAVEGLTETLTALAERRVTTLLVNAGLREHPSAWFAEPPRAVALNPAEVFEHHRAVRRGPLVDVAVRAALLAGADIRVLPPDAAGGPQEGLGALCRLEQPANSIGAVVPELRLTVPHRPQHPVTARRLRGQSRPGRHR